MSTAVHTMQTSGRTSSRSFDRVEQVDARMLALMRCVLAFSAAVIIWIDPAEPQRLVGLTYGSLVLYCAYSAILAFLSYRSGWPAPHRALHWTDVLFYTYLVSLTEGTSSIFFYFYLFAILVASFSRGFREGMAVTAVSLVLFMTVGLVAAPSGTEFELNRTLIRPVYLFALGYMIAYWGGYERLLKRRLLFLQEVNNLWNPRFGVDHAVGANLDRLVDFYEAESCILVLRRPAPERFVMYRASPQKAGRSAVPAEITRGAAEPLLRLPETLAAYYREGSRAWWRKIGGYAAYDLAMRARTDAFRGECAALANLLDAGGFITVPYAQRNGTAGRIYLIAGDLRFTQADIDFLAQAAGAISTVVESMSLMEELISRAAEHERLKISRDLHDTTIQPYIGLKLALDALQREAGPDSRVAHRIAELVDMTGMTIRDLRSYAASLKETAAMPGDFLIAAIAKQAERLQKFYGVDVELKTDISPQLNGRMAAEAFQIVSEGLSNVLRHTRAKSAFVFILCEDSSLLLEIGNEARDSPSPAGFTPRSIHERAQALGGRTSVERRADGYTVVHVTIPM